MHGVGKPRCSAELKLRIWKGKVQRNCNPHSGFKRTKIVWELDFSGMANVRAAVGKLPSAHE
jgi:hypothetical protein